MEFDINEVLADMAQAIKGEVGDAWTEVQAVANQFLHQRKIRLELLAELTLSGDLTMDKLELRLNHERLLAEAEFHAIAVITKATAQRAANAAMDILKKAVQSILDATV